MTQNISNENSTPETVPLEGRLFGLDPGEKRIGVAISTYEQNIASPLDNYTRHGDGPDGHYFQQMTETYSIVGLVVGLPVHMSGEEGEQARRARVFGKWVGELTGLPVQFYDERFTSAMAEQCLQEASLTSQQRKARRDKLAAMFMLQSFIDSDPIHRQTPPGSM